MGRLWSAAAVMGKHTADLSTSLRSGRDDKGWGGYGPRQQSWESTPQISPLRCAPVEMTKGGAVMVRGSSHGKAHRRSLHSLRSGRDDKGWGGYGPRQQSWESTPQISPLRCAPVEMTKGGAVMGRGSSHGKIHRRSLPSLRSGRDDKGWGGYGPRQQSWGNTPQISPLRCAPVEMTKGGAVMVSGGRHGETHRRCLTSSP